MSSSYRIELDNWLRQLDVKADSVLDIGGSQLPVKGRTHSWDVKQYTIADLEEPHVGSPKPDIILDLNKSWIEQRSGLRKSIGKKYDMIFCLEVFDYIYDPVTAFRTLEWFMPKAGTAWVTFPFVYPTHQPIEDDALRYTEFGIRKLAALVGLDIEEIVRRRPESAAIEVLWRSERMRAAKHYDHNVTGWIVKLRKAA